jgi:hypothetical protein
VSPRLCGRGDLKRRKASLLTIDVVRVAEVEGTNRDLDRRLQKEKEEVCVGCFAAYPHCIIPPDVVRLDQGKARLDRSNKESAAKLEEAEKQWKARLERAVNEVKAKHREGYEKWRLEAKSLKEAKAKVFCRRVLCLCVKRHQIRPCSCASPQEIGKILVEAEEKKREALAAVESRSKDAVQRANDAQQKLREVRPYSYWQRGCHNLTNVGNHAGAQRVETGCRATEAPA